MLEQRSSIIEIAAKEIKRKEQGKGLYDSEEEKDRQSVESLQLRPEDQLLDIAVGSTVFNATKSKVIGEEPEVVERLFNGLTQSQVAQYTERTAELEQLALKLGAFTANYTAEREYHPRDSYERARYDRLVWKFVVYSNIVQSRLNALRRIIEGERLTLEQKEETDYSDGGYSEPGEINEDLSKLKVRRRIPIPRKEDYEDTDKEQEELRHKSEHKFETEAELGSETEENDINIMFNGAGGAGHGR